MEPLDGDIAPSRASARVDRESGDRLDEAPAPHYLDRVDGENAYPAHVPPSSQHRALNITESDSRASNAGTLSVEGPIAYTRVFGSTD